MHLRAIVYSQGVLRVPTAENDYVILPNEGGGQGCTVQAKASLHTPYTVLCELGLFLHSN